MHFVLTAGNVRNRMFPEFGVSGQTPDEAAWEHRGRGMAGDKAHSNVKSSNTDGLGQLCYPSRSNEKQRGDSIEVYTERN